MITWIKFSERQPEKEGDYLCHYNSLHPEYSCYLPGNYVLSWEPLGKLFFNLKDGSKNAKDPDYWAEINPPKQDDMSWDAGIEDFQNLKDLPKKESPMPEKPLCKDCRWIGDCRMDHGHAICGAPKAARSLVDGNPVQGCGGLREPRPSASADRTCGPEGRWFEAKEEEKIMCEAKGGVEVIFKGADESKVAPAQENLALATKIMDLMINAGVKNERAIDILMVAVQLSCPDYDVSLKISNRYQ